MLALAGCGAGPSGNNTTDGTTASGVGTAGNGTVGTNATADTTEAETGANASDGANATGNASLNVDALESRHVQTVREAGSLTVVVNATSESDRVRTTTNAVARVDLTNGTSYQQSDSRRALVGNASNGSNDSTAGGQSATTQSVALYTADNTTYVRVASGDGEPRYRVANGSAGQSPVATSNEQFVTLQGVFQVADATAWTQSGNETGAGTTYTASGADSIDVDALFGTNASGMDRNVSAGENGSTNASGAPPLDVNVTAYDATLVVSENGTLDEFRYTMTVDLGGRETTISRSYDVRDVGETTVEEPPWLDEANAQAAGTSSGSANGTASADASA